MDWRGKRPTPDQLRDVLETHARWRAGTGGERADLQRAYLRGADLQGADLQRAYLQNADLQRAYLQGADLQGADLRGADLRDADLQRADLRGADLRGADLRGADLRDANGAALAIALTRILPDGDLIGWKACQGGVIVRLRIPADAKRSHAFGRKCRAEYADVLEVIGATEGRTDQTRQGGSVAVYRAGQRVVPDSWDDDWRNECSHGIHFYITREEAEAQA